MEFLDSVEKAKVNPDGQLSPWQMTTPLDERRGMFSVVEYKDWIYVIGGTNRDNYLSSVAYATTNQEADFGYWGSEADEKTYEERSAAQKQKQTQLPNIGTVRTVLQAQAYTYLEVVTLKNEVVWLAGPKVSVQPNSLVRYSTGVLMSGFYSKELNRTFREILFVGEVKKVD